MKNQLVNMMDAAVLIRRIKRRAAARRLAGLVQSGAVSSEDYRVVFSECDDVVIDAALRLALRAREQSAPMNAGTAVVRGIIELQADRERWAARAGSVSSKGFEFPLAADAIEWLEAAVAQFVREQFSRDDYEYDYYLQIGIVEERVSCRSALPRNEGGYCEVCWAVEQADRETWDVVSRRAVDEVCVDGSIMGTRGVAEPVREYPLCDTSRGCSGYGKVVS